MDFTAGTARVVQLPPFGSFSRNNRQAKPISRLKNAGCSNTRKPSTSNSLGSGILWAHSGCHLVTCRSSAKRTCRFQHRHPNSNKYAFHALAIDEHRKAFTPTLWTVDFAKDAPKPHHRRTLSQVEQRWFVGAHANVGGGCQGDPLPQGPLQWMMDKAARSGLAFRQEIELDTLASPPQISDSYSEFLRGAYKLLTGGQRFYREIGAAPAPSSSTEFRESINETVDASVFERWRWDPTYRPLNLVRWEPAPGGCWHAHDHGARRRTFVAVVGFLEGTPRSSSSSPCAQARSLQGKK